jgi:hypothetical protein
MLGRVVCLLVSLSAIIAVTITTVHRSRARRRGRVYLNTRMAFALQHHLRVNSPPLREYQENIREEVLLDCFFKSKNHDVEAREEEQGCQRRIGSLGACENDTRLIGV